MRRTAFMPTIARAIARTRRKTPGARCRTGSGNTAFSPDAQSGCSDRDVEEASRLSAEAVALAMRFRDLFDFPECPDKGGAEADDDAKENQGQGGGCEHGQHTLLSCKQHTTGKAKSRWLRCDNTGAISTISRRRNARGRRNP